MWLSDHVRGLLLLFLAAVVARIGWESAPMLLDRMSAFCSEKVTPLLDKASTQWAASGTGGRTLMVVGGLAIAAVAFYLLYAVLYIVLHPLECAYRAVEALGGGLFALFMLVDCIPKPRWWPKIRRTRAGKSVDKAAPTA